MLRRIHSLPGLIAAVVVSILALTGAVLAINPALERAGSSIPPAGEVSVAELAQRVVAHFPGVERIVRKASGAIVVYYFDAEVPGAAVVDPRTGVQIAPFAPSAFTRWVTDLHRSFLMGDAGRAAAGIGALAMLVLTVSGATMLATRLGGWRRLFGRVRGTGSQRLHAQFPGKPVKPGHGLQQGPAIDAAAVEHVAVEVVSRPAGEFHAQHVAHGSALHGGLLCKGRSYGLIENA